MTDDASTLPAQRTVAAPLKALDGVRLKRLADGGGFAVDATTGDQLIAALEGVLDTLQARWNALEKLRATPALSTSPAGQWVAGHMAATANDEHGLLTQLQQAKAEFPTYIEAIQQAKRNYRSGEEESKTELTRIRVPGEE